MLGYLKHQLSNISKLRAVSLPRFFWRGLTFLFDFYLCDGRSCLPIIVTIDLTLRCNSKCKMCYLKPFLNTGDAELTTEEWKSFIDTLHWKPTIYLTGGEPTMRPDLLEIIKHIHSRGLRWGITTNGMHMPDISKYEPAFVDVSLDGIGEVHDRIRGVPGAFDRTVKNLGELCARKTRRTRVFINFTLTENVGEIEKMIQLVKEVGADGLKIHQLSYHTPEEMARQRRRHPLAYFEAKDIKMDIDVNKIRGLGKKHGVPIIFRPELSQDEIPKWYNNNFGLPIKCYYSYFSPRIEPDGSVIACQFIRVRVADDIMKEPLDKIWNNDEYRRLRRIKQRGGYCELCKRCCKS